MSEYSDYTVSMATGSGDWTWKEQAEMVKWTRVSNSTHFTGFLCSQT